MTTDARDDDLQQLLERYTADPTTVSTAELEGAIDGLARDWRRRVRRFLQQPSPEEVEDLLQGALLALVLPRDGGEPRVLAPPGGSPTAWRRRVLKNWLIDQVRSKRRQDHLRKGVARGWAPATEKEVWRREKAVRQGAPGPGLRLVASPQEPVGPSSEDWADVVRWRRRVVSMLPELPVRRRVLVAMAMGADPTPFATELAVALDEGTAAVLSRMHVALTEPHDANHDYLSQPMVRVVYPEPKPLGAAREAARKALDNAIVDLKRRAR